MSEINFNSRRNSNIRNELSNEQTRIGKIQQDWQKIQKRRLNIPFLDLEKKYFIITKKLNTKLRSSIEKTTSEKYLARLIKKSSRNSFMRSIWIGPYNFDFFFVQFGQLGLEAVKGYVIEVDGSVHDRQLKMSKDQMRYDLLLSLKIGVISVSNNEISEHTFQNIISNLKSLRRLDNRQRKRILRKIYLLTIVSHLNQNEIELFISQKSKKIVRNGCRNEI